MWRLVVSFRYWSSDTVHLIFFGTGSPIGLMLTKLARLPELQVPGITSHPHSVVLGLYDDVTAI